MQMNEVGMWATTELQKNIRPQIVPEIGTGYCIDESPYMVVVLKASLFSSIQCHTSHWEVMRELAYLVSHPYSVCTLHFADPYACYQRGSHQ